MGWANCGKDSQGRPIGYAFEATCDHPGCDAKIDRGLSYACGGMHGEDELSCEKYFCEIHRSEWVRKRGGQIVQVCKECGDFWRRKYRTKPQRSTRNNFHLRGDL